MDVLSQVLSVAQPLSTIPVSVCLLLSDATFLT